MTLILRGGAYGESLEASLAPFEAEHNVDIEVMLMSFDDLHILRLRLIVAALRLAVAIRSGLRHAERSSANAQILASRGVLRDGLAVIVVNRYFLLGNVAIEEVGNGRSRDCRTIPIAVVPAVDGNVGNTVGVRVLCIADHSERRNLIRNERSTGHRKILTGTGLTKRLTPVSQSE